MVSKPQPPPCYFIAFNTIFSISFWLELPKILQVKPSHGVNVITWQIKVQLCCTLYQWYIHDEAVGGLCMPANKFSKGGELLASGQLSNSSTNHYHTHPTFFRQQALPAIVLLCSPNKMPHVLQVCLVYWDLSVLGFWGVGISVDGVEDLWCGALWVCGIGALTKHRRINLGKNVALLMVCWRDFMQIWILDLMISLRFELNFFHHQYIY